MDRVGVSFQSLLSADDVRRQFIEPMRAALENARAGIYTNYLQQRDEGDGPPEHLLMFQVREFEEGLRLLRVTLEQIGVPGVARFHNLNASEPMY